MAQNMNAICSPLTQLTFLELPGIHACQTSQAGETVQFPQPSCRTKLPVQWLHILCYVFLYMPIFPYLAGDMHYLETGNTLSTYLKHNLNGL